MYFNRGKKPAIIADLGYHFSSDSLRGGSPEKRAIYSCNIIIF